MIRDNRPAGTRCTCSSSRRREDYPDVTALAEGDPKLLAHMVEIARVAASQAGADRLPPRCSTRASAPARPSSTSTRTSWRSALGAAR